MFSIIIGGFILLHGHRMAKAGRSGAGWRSVGGRSAVGRRSEVGRRSVGGRSEVGRATIL